MKRESGFTFIELLVTIAILAIIAVVIVLNVGNFFAIEPPSNEVSPYNSTRMDELFREPLSSLNATELQLMADYCMWHSNDAYGNRVDVKARWAIQAAVYQNQIIIQNAR